MLLLWEPGSRGASPHRGLQRGRCPQETRAWHFSLKGWRVNIFAFVGYTVSVATTYSAVGAGKWPQTIHK